METATDTYLTLLDESRAIYREKASKFIAVATPVENEGEVKTKLEAIRKMYFDANHHCYAYQLGTENTVYRVNDDGEPSGSAGKPIYGQILSKGLTNVLIVVTRYFGGTKLGIPGLIHAYKTAAREAIENGKIVEKTVMLSARLIFAYESMNQVMRIIKEEQLKVTGQTSGEQCIIDIQIRKGSWPKIQGKITGLRNIKIEGLN